MTICIVPISMTIRIESIQSTRLISQIRDNRLVVLLHIVVDHHSVYDINDTVTIEVTGRCQRPLTITLSNSDIADHVVVIARVDQSVSREV